jgi:NADPH-dependent glutamate synthase beta subunit-like oxidoreductase
LSGQCSNSYLKVIRLKINNREVRVEKGSSILSAAGKLNIHIPAMCFNEEAGGFASCMVCVVKETITGKFMPSCSVIAEEGMNIVTDDEEVREARRIALELLLSDHVGDCQAPCQITCPAHMEIPLMNRLLAEGRTDEALQAVIRDIPFPAVLGRICPAPCESACRRKYVDDPVSICLLKRFAGDVGTWPGNSRKVKLIPDKKIAIIGAGPTGITAAYYLSQSGYRCIIFDNHEEPGGMLRYGVPRENLPLEVLNREIKSIFNPAIEFKPGMLIDNGMFDRIVHSHDATLIATGDLNDSVSSWNILSGPTGIQVEKNNYRTSLPNVFAAGNVIRSSKMAVRSVAHGKEAAISIQQFLAGQEVTGYVPVFNSRFGKLNNDEIAEYLKESVSGKRINPGGGLTEGYSAQETMQEAARCLHCDCRDARTCKLRIFANEYAANQKRFAGDNRKSVTKKFIHDRIIYEPAKCIKCGICVRLAEKYKEKFGFTYIGRGFDVQIGIPFNKDIRTYLEETAEKIALACPTGALAVKKDKAGENSEGINHKSQEGTK